MKTIKEGKSIIHMQAIAEMKKMQRKQHKLSFKQAMCRLEFVSVRNEIEFLSALNVTSCEVFYSNSQNHVPYETKSPSTYQVNERYYVQGRRKVSKSGWGIASIKVAGIICLPASAVLTAQMPVCEKLTNSLIYYFFYAKSLTMTVIIFKIIFIFLHHVTHKHEWSKA